MRFEVPSEETMEKIRIRLADSGFRTEISDAGVELNGVAVDIRD